MVCKRLFLVVLCNLYYHIHYGFRFVIKALIGLNEIPEQKADISEYIFMRGV